VFPRRCVGVRQEENDEAGHRGRATSNSGSGRDGGWTLGSRARRRLPGTRFAGAGAVLALRWPTNGLKNGASEALSVMVKAARALTRHWARYPDAAKVGGRDAGHGGEQSAGRVYEDGQSEIGCTTPPAASPGQQRGLSSPWERAWQRSRGIAGVVPQRTPANGGRKGNRHCGPPHECCHPSAE
jgi:hypothetical protein